MPNDERRMNDESQMTNQQPKASAAAATPGLSADAIAAAARKKKWDRITLVIVVAMIAIWVPALIFHRNIRANYFAWRLSSASGEPARNELIDNIVSQGDAAIGPAMRLTRNSNPELRLAGQLILRRLIDNRQLAEAGKSDMGNLPPGVAAKLAPRPKIEPEIVQRFREMLDDDSPQVQENSIFLAELADDAQALGKLIALAEKPGNSEVGVDAVRAIGRIGEHDGKPPTDTLCKILAGTTSPDVRAQAIESLARDRSAATLRALAGVLTDDRKVTVVPTSETFFPEPPAAVMQMLGKNRMPMPTRVGQPTSGPSSWDPRTVSDYAARMLAHMTATPLGPAVDAPGGRAPGAHQGIPRRRHPQRG